MTTSHASITLFGATGYTGQRIARALAREGLPFRLAGRSAEKLARLSDALPGHPAWLTADVTHPASLPPLFQDTRLLINCAGPFTDLGERVIAQAAMSGAHYLDITNELGYVFRARGYSELARKTGAALVPACGFEVALADCAAQLAAEALPEVSETNPLDAVDVVYRLGGSASSGGTRKSAVRSLATSWIAYRDGAWTGQMPGGRVHTFDLPAGSAPALSIPSCESITVPAHLPVRRVDAWMTTTPRARFWAPLLVPLLARLSRSILRGLILRIAEAGGEKSPEPAAAAGPRNDAPFTIYVQARRGAERSWLALAGLDPYDLTAEIIAYAARQMTQTGYDRRGFLAPAQALDPADLLGYEQKNWKVTLTRGD